MARYEYRHAGTPDTTRRNPFTGEMLALPSRDPGWLKSLTLSQHDDALVLQFGKNEHTRRLTQRFASGDHARAHLAEIVASHLESGYAQISDEELDRERERVEDADAGLLARMAAGERDAYLVYADELLERGDPRGELIALLVEDASQETVRDGVDALLERHPELVPKPLEGSDDLAWRLGFLDSVRVGYSSMRAYGSFSASEQLEAIFTHPSGRLLRALTVGIPSDGPPRFGDVLDTIALFAPASLSRLVIGDFEYPEDTEISWVELGDASMLWLALPTLEEVSFQGGSLTLGAIHAPKLRSVTIRSGGLGREPVRALARATLPSLEKLEIWLGSPLYGGDATVDDLLPLFEGTRAPKLRHLGLCNAEITDGLCEALVRSKLLPRLEKLDLSKGTLTDAGAASLLDAREALAHLALLDVSENCLSAAMCTRLHAAFENVRTNDQKAEDERYASVSE